MTGQLFRSLLDGVIVAVSMLALGWITALGGAFHNAGDRSPRTQRTSAERGMSAPRLVLYGRADCHLCDEMKAVVDEVRRDVALELTVVDVDTDAALVAAYGLEVPVLLIDGRKAFKYRVDAGALRRRLARGSA